MGETLDHDRALVLVTGGLDSLWHETVAAGADAVAASNVIANQLVGAAIAPGAVDPTELAKLVGARERIPRKTFDEAIARVAEPGFTAEPYLAQEAVSDTASLEPIVDAILTANPAQVEQYRAGKEGLLGLLRRPGDEGDEGSGRRARGQRARPREALVVDSRSPSAVRSTACPSRRTAGSASTSCGSRRETTRCRSRRSAGRSRRSGSTTS